VAIISFIFCGLSHRQIHVRKRLNDFPTAGQKWAGLRWFSQVSSVNGRLNAAGVCLGERQKESVHRGEKRWGISGSVVSSGWSAKQL
jgi:hypothetical protein